MSRLMLAVLCPIIILGALEPGKVLATENGRASTQSSVAQGLSPRQDPPQTAEDVFNALRLKRPTTTIVPESRRGRGSILAASDRLIFPEGHQISRRLGRIVREGNWWTFVPEEGGPGEREPALKLLLNSTLGGMVRTARASEGDMTFEVSGEVTVFQGENYLFPQTARPQRVGRGDPAQALKPPPPVSDPPKAVEPPGAGRPPPTASARAVLEAMQRQRPVTLRIVPSEIGTEGAAATPRVGSLLPEGQPISRRKGRIIREGSWWVFVFESDHPDRPEPPLKLLPNATLQQMVRAAQPGGPGVVFVLSAQVTTFGAENYLLPWLAMRHVGGGNFSK